MSTKKRHIWITGASGCIGHYVLDQLLPREDLHLHLLARDPKRIRRPIDTAGNVSIHQGNLSEIEAHLDTISEMDAMIHIATDWSNSDYAHHLNVTKTKIMMDALDLKKVQKILYFSTASILGPQNQPVPEAGKYGSGYIRSKYHAYFELKKQAYADQLVTLFPTMVFGGDPTHPYSHISQGIVPNQRYLKWLRFLNVTGHFHFMHSQDIATVTTHLLDHPAPNQDLVLGFAPIMASIIPIVLSALIGIYLLRKSG